MDKVKQKYGLSEAEIQANLKITLFMNFSLRKWKADFAFKPFLSDGILYDATVYEVSKEPHKHIWQFEKSISVKVISEGLCLCLFSIQTDNVLNALFIQSLNAQLLEEEGFAAFAPFSKEFLLQQVSPVDAERLRKMK